MRILLVEDDREIASFVAKGLRQASYAVDVVTDGEEGLDRALGESYDAAVVDIMLPKRNGLSLIEELRRQKVKTPVIVLSAKRSVDDRIKGLQAGGDDYLTKPFSFSELLARIQALMRRASGVSEPTSLEAGDLQLDLLKREVTRKSRTVILPGREYALLEYLLRNAGRPVSKTMILEHVWDYDFDPQTSVVDVLVSRLRQKIDEGFKQKLIHTVRGVGYVLKAS
jgi:two-component system OmpR family response regulator